MESRDSNDVVAVNGSQWRWWLASSVTQFSLGVFLWRRPYNGKTSLLPIKAFFVGSLFPASILTASIASLQASGINKVEELVEAGANLRKCLGVRSTSGKELQFKDAKVAAMDFFVSTLTFLFISIFVRFFYGMYRHFIVVHCDGTTS